MYLRDMIRSMVFRTSRRNDLGSWTLRRWKGGGGAGGGGGGGGGRSYTRSEPWVMPYGYRFCQVCGLKQKSCLVPVGVLRSECEVKGEFCTSAKLVRTLHFVGTGVMGMLLLLVAAGSIGSDMNKNVKGTKVHTFTHFVHTSHIHTHTHKFRCAILRWMTPNREQAI